MAAVQVTYANSDDPGEVLSTCVLQIDLSSLTTQSDMDAMEIAELLAGSSAVRHTVSQNGEPAAVLYVAMTDEWRRLK
jgi:hypothetical protein